MNQLHDPVKRLVRRFVSLPPHARLRIAGSLLRRHDGSPGGRSLLEEFWDEVEAAHGDGLYPVNPFAPGLISRGALQLPQQRLVRLSC
ncbi:MAG TPA: hypothetical protein VJT74_13130 [Pyrinomonadaceae bacterium]|nr:hypothetical protein [Pyrinomonadaceae bacterium]